MRRKFYEMAPSERITLLAEESGLAHSHVEVLEGKRALPVSLADHLIENAVGFFPMPLGIAQHFVIDKKAYWVPMCVEETSVIAAASAGAKWIQQKGGLETKALGRSTLGQMDLGWVEDAESIHARFQEVKQQWLEFLPSLMPSMEARGGGLRGIELRALGSEGRFRMILHLEIDTVDAQGANKVTQIAEAFKVRVLEDLGLEVRTCIVSNYATGRLVQAKARLQGVEKELGASIEDISRWAELDPYRATTHNKGILNGVDAVLLATGNDWRAVEAGAHAYACRSGQVKPLSVWRYDALTETLTGQLEMPMAVATVGGLTRLHPIVECCLKILKVETALELARIAAAVGLAQNLSALKALVSAGLSQGHMRLHASNIAMQAGVGGLKFQALKQWLEGEARSGRLAGLEQAKAWLETHDGVP